MYNFWSDLPKPFFALAPMEDVTDTVFRRIVASCARPDVFFTEFTNCDGILSAGRDTVMQRLNYTPDEHPIVAQVWGIHPRSFYECAKIIAGMGFDGLDLNFGCPEKSVVSHGACSAMIDVPQKVKAIIDAAKQGIVDSGKSIGLSVKTRIGYKNISPEWIPFLLEQQLDALTIHGRTAAEMSKAPVHWEEIKRAVRLRDEMKAKTLIIANGDVQNVSEGLQKAETYGLDGVMIGRGIFENLWAFDRSGVRHEPETSELLSLMRQHVRLFDTTWGKEKNFSILKKFFKIYVRGFENAGDVRMRLMGANAAPEVEAIIDELIHNAPKT